ncbi:MAG: hypothetical protein AABY86_17400 [Bdellovibrionota bacterium]
MRFNIKVMVVILSLSSITAHAELEGAMGDAQRNAQNLLNHVRSDDYKKDMKDLKWSSLEPDAGYCLRDVEEALKTNPPTRKIPLMPEPGVTKPYTLAEIRDEICRPQLKEVELRKKMEPVFQPAMRVFTQLKVLAEQQKEGKDTGTTTMLIEADAKECLQKVQEALKAGVPNTRVIALDNQDVALKTIHDQCASGGKTGAQVASVAKVQEEAKFAPFVKVLSGDKLKVFNETHRIGMKVYGSGGKILMNPEQFEKATAWFTVGVNRDGLIPQWSLDVYRFNGMNKKEVDTKTGSGEEPPSEEFK